jgi:hypothetical protein
MALLSGTPRRDHLRECNIWMTTRQARATADRYPQREVMEDRQVSGVLNRLGPFILSDLA